MRFRYADTPWGRALLTADEEGLRSLDFEHSGRGPRPEPGWVEDAGSGSLLAEASRQLRDYARGKRKVFDLELSPVGTAFQLSVWKALQRVPFGATITYSELARRAGRPKAIRAAGAANGQNPISVIIPCHRILGKRGDLRGYGGGLDVKLALLRHEGFLATPSRDGG